MKNVEKITKIVTILMVVMMLATICTNVFAAVKGTSPDTFTGSQDKLNTTEVSSWINSIINVVSMVASGAAIIILIILGIKYMMGSAEEKADYKKTLLPYVIGAVFVFGAGVLTNIIYNTMNKTS